jgi:uncharacterized membrane protein YbaN (DUF454 family)
MVTSFLLIRAGHMVKSQSRVSARLLQPTTRWVTPMVTARRRDRHRAKISACIISMTSSMGFFWMDGLYLNTKAKWGAGGTLLKNLT